MKEKGPFTSEPPRSGKAAISDPSPRRIAAQINIEAQTEKYHDDGTLLWGIYKFNEGNPVGWVRTGLSFEAAKNIALDFSSNASDLGIEYRVFRQLDPEHTTEEITIAGPVIRATSGTVLWGTQTQQNVLPRREVKVRVPVVAEKRAIAPRPTALELEEMAHAHSRESADAIIADLRAENERLNNINERIIQSIDEADNAQVAEMQERLEFAQARITDLEAQRNTLDEQLETLQDELSDTRTLLDEAHAQITELQSRPADPNLTAAPNDSLTLAYLRKWYQGLSEKDRDAQPLLIHDLAVPWHKRSIVWAQIVRVCSGKVGKTPYEMSPPKSVSKGQGAIQPKKPAA